MATGALQPPRYARQSRRWSPLEIAMGVVTSVGLHATLAGVILLGTFYGDKATNERVEEHKIEFEEVEMLALGEKKPDHQLPRISNPAPPEPQQETVVLDDKQPEPKPDEQQPPEEQQRDKKKAAEDPPERKPDPRAETREKQMEQALQQLNNPNRPTNQVVPEGSPEGVRSGTATDPELANQKATYQTKLKEAIVDRWLIPTTLSDEKLTKLAGSVVVRVRLADNGSILSYQFVQESANEQFNSSIERALRQFQPTGGGHTLPLPDHDKLRKMVLNSPLNLRDWDPTTRR